VVESELGVVDGNFERRDPTLRVPGDRRVERPPDALEVALVGRTEDDVDLGLLRSACLSG